MQLQLEDVYKSFKSKEVLKGIGLQMENGVYELLGPNGVGKTTLIRILADVLLPTKGRVLMNGLDKNTCGELYRSKIGFLPQDMVFYNDFTGFDYLGFAAALKELSPAEAEGRIRELAEIVGLQNDLHRKCAAYSGGMKRRLGIAQALLNQPEILILDEPSAGLDPQERIKLRQIISAFSKDRLVLLSTHIVSDVDSIAKQVMMMESGVINLKASSAEFIRQVEGCVWTLMIPATALEVFQQNTVVSNVVPSGDMMQVRVIDEKQPSADAEHAAPNLEDAYLFIFQYTQGRNA
jgi:ABC-2 type transport system ATP-binding protein